ncbi:MAG: metal ABC transporter substrate-binding protein [Phycisphaerales bacterium]
MHLPTKTARAFAITLAVGLPLAALPLAGCNEQASTSQTGQFAMRDAVLTTFYPTRYFAERIAGGLVIVDSPLPADEDPIFWRPGADAMNQFQNAKVVITNGAEFEKWVAGAALPRGRTVASLSDDTLEQLGGPITMESTTHSHGPGGEHTHEGVDGHTWVSPRLAIAQAERIAEAMATAWPEHAEAFGTNLATLVEDLEMLETSLRDLTPLVQQHRLLASHPAYNYLARDLGWDIHNLDLDPESEDTQAMVDMVHNALHHHEDHHHDHGHEHDDGHRHEHDQDHEHEHTHGDKPVLLLWEGEPTSELRDAIRGELGVVSVLFSPAEGVPDDGDYMDVMRANIERLRAAVGG